MFRFIIYLFSVFGFILCNFTCKKSETQTVCLPEDYDSFTPPAELPVLVDVQPNFEMIQGVDQAMIIYNRMAKIKSAESH